MIYQNVFVANLLQNILFYITEKEVLQVWNDMRVRNW